MSKSASAAALATRERHSSRPSELLQRVHRYLATKGDTLEDYVASRGAIVATNFKELGDGIDLRDMTSPKGQVAADEWIEDKADKRSAEAPRFCVFISDSSSSTEHSASEGLNVDASASLGIGDFSAAYKQSGSTYSFQSTNTITVRIHAWSYHNTVELKLDSPKAGLNGIAKNAASSPDDFAVAFGEAFVQRLHYGASIDAVFELTSTNAEARSTCSRFLEAHADGLWGSANITDQMTSTEKDMFEQTVVTIRVNPFALNQEGKFPRPNLTASKGSAALENFCGTAAAMLTYIGDVKNGLPVGISYLATRYLDPSDLSDLPLPDAPPWASSRREKMRILFDGWTYLNELTQHYASLARQQFAEGDSRYKLAFSTAAVLFSTTQAHIEGTANSIAKGSLSDDEINNLLATISFDSILRCPLAAQQSSDLGLGGAEIANFDVTTVPESPIIVAARKSYPLRLKIVWERWEGTFNSAPGDPVQQQWTVGFRVLQNGTDDVGDLNVFTIHPVAPNPYAPGNQQFGVAFDIGAEIIVDLKADWNALTIDPIFDTTAPSHSDPSAGMSSGSFNRKQIIDALNGDSHITMNGGVFWFKPYCSIEPLLLRISLDSR